MGSTFIGTEIGPAAGTETLADMTLRVARRVRDTLSGVATGGGGNYLIDIDELILPSSTFDNGILWILSGTYMGRVIPRLQSHIDNRLNFSRTLGAAICAQQVETLTVLGTITGGGYATVTLTAALLEGSPKVFSVAVTNAWTASQVAAAVRTALAADPDVVDVFDVTGANADVVLTAKRAAANDATLNLAITNGTCTGLTPVATSADTLAGAAGPHYAVCDSAIPFYEIVSGINQALRMIHVPAESTDVGMVGDGTTLEFTLPAGVYNVFEVYGERVNDADNRYFKAHVRERNGKIRFDRGFAPRDGEILHVWYAKPHSPLSVYNDAIDDDVVLEWVEAQAVFNVCMWARKKYGKDPRFDLETQLQVATQELKGLAKNKRARVMTHSGGRSDGSSVFTY